MGWLTEDENLSQAKGYIESHTCMLSPFLSQKEESEIWQLVDFEASRFMCMMGPCVSRESNA